MAFALISLRLLDCLNKSLQADQLPQEHLFFLQILLNFIITKYLKQEVDGNLKKTSWALSMDGVEPREG